MSLFLSLAALSLANLTVWAAALMCGGQLMPQTLAGFYAATPLWPRAVITGLAYMPAIAGFVLPFRHHPAPSSLLQSGFNAGFVVLMAVVVGGKPFTPQTAVASGLVALSSLYLSYTLLPAAPAVPQPLG